MNINTIFEDYLEYCKLYKKNGTYLAYKKSFLLLNKIFFDLNINDTNDFNSKTFDVLVKWLKLNTHKKNSKINSLLSDMMSAFRKYGINLPFIQNKLVDDTTHYKSLNDEELRRLLLYLNSLETHKSNNFVWITSVLILLDTGVRKSELLNIETKNVDLENNIIYLEVTKNKKRIVRYGSLSKRFVQSMYDGTKKYLIWNKLRDEKLSRRSLEIFFEKINKNLNLDSGNIFPHRLRKTFATRLLKKGCPITTIQKLLGHSDIKMTMIYLDIDQEIIEKDFINFYPY